MSSYLLNISKVIIPGQVSKLQGTFLISVKFVPQGRPPPEGGGLSQVSWTSLVAAPQVAVHGEIVRGRLQLPLTSGAVVHKNELIRLILHYACFAPDFEVGGLRSHLPFPWNQIFPQKIPEISREHPLPRPDSVPAFGTGFFPARFRSGNIWEFPNTSQMKNYYFPDFSGFPEQWDHKEVVLSWYSQLRNWLPVSSCLISFKTSSGMQTSILQCCNTFCVTLINCLPIVWYRERHACN